MSAALRKAGRGAGMALALCLALLAADIETEKAMPLTAVAAATVRR